jgi:parallel beta-helix repeat protein
MLAQSPWTARFCKAALMIFCGVALAHSATVDIHPGANIPSVVAANPAGTTFVIYPGTYRLTSPIEPKNGDSFIGQTACAPPNTSCPAILSGSRVVGSEATYNGKYYEVTGQTQQNSTDGVASTKCQPGWSGCIFPEDLFFDGVPLQHLNASTLPTIGTNQFWFDYSNNIIYFKNNPSGHVVEASFVPSAFASTANNVTIQYLTIKEFASSPGTPATVGMSGNPNLTQGVSWNISNNEILLNHGYGVRVSYKMTVNANYIHNNGWIGVGGGLATDANTRSVQSGIVISNNTITYNNYAHFLPQFGSGGIKICATTGVVIKGNTIAHNDGAGIHEDMSDTSPTIDGNTISYNTGGGGIEYEVSLTSALIRNNILLGNGANTSSESGTSSNLGVYASPGTSSYCNVLIQAPMANAEGLMIVGSNRGSNPYPPGEFLLATGNSFHHNTIFWQAGASGIIGYYFNDVANQPDFFSQNTPPDDNMYHVTSLSQKTFVYDNNESEKNTLKTFAQFQSAGADEHGTIDTKYNSPYPTVKITAPANLAALTANSATIQATASDSSGIAKVEFFVDWTLKSTDTSGPFSFDWTDIPAGTHTITAMAYNNDGIGVCNAITVTKN